MRSGRFDLSSKVALITGGGRGIGRAITIGFAEHGADVAICSRTKSQLESVAEEVVKIG
ncbi:SDR family NAD(P)-dependent oxidoreductase, partial [Candidatus Bathyarchaeota archaeon]|nr:SDR family NAD(P)-dependent oxidoreductase [Candidatus Bathyarchaeota archaeon]